VDVPAGDFAQRLGGWFGAVDAIALQSTLQAIRHLDAPAAGHRPRLDDLRQDIERVRAALAQAIARDVPRPVEIEVGPGRRLRLGADGPTAIRRDEDAGYAVFRQRHLDLQRHMDQMIAPLRDHLREALARASRGLRQLAALDSTLERVLAPREQALLPGAAALLEHRHRQLRAAAAAGDETWRERFEQEWRDALHAELALRLEPVHGLLEALAETTEHWK
jgi:hypothetical protein